MHPALGILELAHIARGVRTADALLKRAEVSLLASRPVSGGKHLIFLRGDVAELEEAMGEGREIAGDALVDSLMLPMLDEQLWPCLPDPVSGLGEQPAGPADSAAIVETATVCAAVAAADASVKAAPVTVRDMRLAVGIAGKAFYTMTGDLNDVEAAAEAASQAAGGRLVSLEIIPRPIGELIGQLIH